MELANSSNYLLKHNFSARSRYIAYNSHSRTSNFYKSLTDKNFSVPDALEDFNSHSMKQSSKRPRFLVFLPGQSWIGDMVYAHKPSGLDHA